MGQWGPGTARDGHQWDLSRLVVELGEEPRCPAAIENHAVPFFEGVAGWGDARLLVSSPALAANWEQPM